MKTETKVEATPGPWAIRFFKESEPEQGFFVEGPKVDPSTPYNTEILSEDSSYYPIERRLADAKLIAAAPELLEALEQILSDANSADYEGSFSEASHIKAKEAIKKARGL